MLNRMFLSDAERHLYAIINYQETLCTDLKQWSGEGGIREMFRKSSAKSHILPRKEVVLELKAIYEQSAIWHPPAAQTRIQKH